MADVEGLAFAEQQRVLICKIHGSGVRPEVEAIKRHLRGEGHYCKGRALKEAIVTLTQLPLKTCQELLDAHPPPAAQPLPAIPHLRVQDGWSCVLCDGSALTTSHFVRDRHAAKAHNLKPRAHCEDRPFWRACHLQSLFSMTGDVRYFQVTPRLSSREYEALHAIRSPNTRPVVSEDERSQYQADCFLESLQAQRKAHKTLVTGAANKVPDPARDDVGMEPWIKKLGLHQYVAGLHKDEMVASYRPPETEDDRALLDLREVSAELLRETWRWCQQGREQRLTEPQAARISSFWQAADPERKNNTFRRAIQPDTLETYVNHWTQLLTFVWNGWRGRLFTQSMAAIHEPIQSHSRPRAISSRTQHVVPRGEGSEELRGEDLDDGSGTSSDSEASSEHARCTVSDNPYVHFTKRLETSIQTFAQASAACSRSSDGNADRRWESLKPLATAVAVALVKQHLPGSPFDSPMLAYTAMLAIDCKTLAWEEPSSFNHHLSALIYCGQLWIFRFCCDNVDGRDQQAGEEDESDDGLDEQLDQHMRRYFSNTVSKPLSHLLLWRRRLFGIAPLTMVNRPATWDLARKTVTYQGVSVSMEDIRHMLQYTLSRARDLLSSRLMFGVDYLPRLMPAHLQENDNDRNIGWWFGKHAENSALLSGSETVLAEHVARTPELRNLYLEERTDASGAQRLLWRQSGVKYYRQCVQDFLRDMAVLIHFGAGPPVRAPEFLSPMWQNTEGLRHIQLRYGKVLIRLVEHKMMAVTGKNVNNIRFLPDDVGELLVNYLVYPLAILQSMAWQEDIALSISPYLWTDAAGTRWPAKQFATILKAACKRARVPEIGTGIWRQMSSAIINTHFDQSDRGCFAVAQDGEVVGDDIDEEGADFLAATLVSMSNHSLRTHRQAYANVSPFANVWDGKLIKSHRASEAWANFFGLGVDVGSLTETLKPSDGQKRRLSDTAEEHESARKVLNIGRPREKRHWTGATLLEQARKLYGKAGLQWKCPEQEQAMRLVANHAPEVLLVLATGSGKSLPFMLGSSLPEARTTIVIVPLVLLRLDLLR
ncbi:hypothetical protein LTR86_011263 [Recurvomyces mirabilis]|nr:hypothetical protein LTR86_011263 [Recurvomyces mirabilis]